MDKSLGEEILELINLKQEGDYWDFKREWYEGDAYDSDMLHDIICMANNQSFRDAYIIIGVDEANDYQPYAFDVSKRRNTQNVVDFLRSKDFAGDGRPVVTVSHVEIGIYNLDVIIIHKSMNTPFFLKKGFRNVNPNNIYTRVQDTNTPKNMSADINQVEKLWKRRFGLLSTPMEQMQIYLNRKDDWKGCYGDEYINYYKYAPEFTVEGHIEDDLTKGYEYYFLNQTDSTPLWSRIRLKYHQTKMEEFQGMSLDGGSYYAPAPDRAFFNPNNNRKPEIYYAYYTEDSLKYAINLFYYDEKDMEEIISRKKLMSLVLLFKNDSERLGFFIYAKEHWEERERYKELIFEPLICNVPNCNMEYYRELIRNVLVLQEMLNTYRTNY